MSGELGADSVEALEVVGAVRVPSGEELCCLTLVHPALPAEASPSLLLGAGDEHPQYAVAAAQRQRGCVRDEHRRAAVSDLLDGTPDQAAELIARRPRFGVCQ